MVDWTKLEPIKTEQDVVDEVNLEQAWAYLNETNWHAFSLLEDGKPIPDDIKDARTAARATINRLSPPSAS
ncbi:hypothetical protein C4J88_2896 [Pseudomonas sp. R4-39-08]|uniref:hypothetical protein n=1 Tax=Pseudomonas sp. R4-39-08 TaxID=1173288 RepID=UPI000F587909|nr:hypothetical protein [Pseudomonas sp. R4-39-08]AZF37678.1 hypothetical protein C4J88_2896 [Pseudomonas sp. R4-39-08]